MSTAPLVQIPSSSVDRQGISIVTTTKTADDPRLGTFYDVVNFAAATPIHFHDMGGNNNFLGVFSRRWTNATVSSGSNPQNYSAYTEDNSPSWAVINSVTGRASSINGSFSIPMKTANDSATAVAGMSIPPSYLYILNTVTSGGVSFPVMQHFLLSNWGVTSALREETLPTLTVDGQTILFNGGMYFNGLHIIVIGMDQNNAIYLARKQYGQIGAANTNWEYQGVTGWSTWDPKLQEIAPVQKVNGTVLTTLDTCTGLLYKGREFLSTVDGNGSDRSATIYEKKKMQWRSLTSIPLGTVGTTYLGPLYLQKALGATPTADILSNQNTYVAAFPYVTSQLAQDTSGSSISVRWDLHPVLGMGNTIPTFPVAAQFSSEGALLNDVLPVSFAGDGALSG